MVRGAEQRKEQKHLDEVLGLIKEKESELDHSIEYTRNEAQNISSHSFDDVELDYDSCSTSMDTALSVHQQQQMLAERRDVW